MTLRELINQCCGEMSKISSAELSKIGSLSVENYENFCRYYIMQYFYSEDFEWDLHNCYLDYNIVISAHLVPYFFFDQTKGKISLQLSGIELYYK